MKLASALNFDTADNACQSLRVLAERVRTGDLRVHLFDIRDDAGQVRIDLKYQPDAPKP